jgi:CTP synthase
LIPGGFGIRGVEGKIRAIEWARKNKKPFLGICLGLQCSVIEFARNVLDLKDAHSSEFAKVESQVVSTKNPIHECLISCSILISYFFVKVIEMPEHNPGQMGGTMRLGSRKTVFRTNDSIMSMSILTPFFTFY